MKLFQPHYHRMGRAWASPMHTSGTALQRLCVCSLFCLFACLQPYTVNFKWVLLNIAWSLLNRVSIGEGCCQSAVSASVCPIWVEPYPLYVLCHYTIELSILEFTVPSEGPPYPSVCRIQWDRWNCPWEFTVPSEKSLVGAYQYIFTQYNMFHIFMWSLFYTISITYHNMYSMYS